MVLYILYYLTNAAACLLALLLWRKESIQLRFQWIYLLINLLSELYFTYEASLHINATYIYSLVIMVEYGFYTWLIGSQYESGNARIIAYSSIGLFIGFGLIHIIGYGNLLPYNYSFLLRCFLFVLSTGWYYYELYISTTTIHLTRLPLFWISSGFFIFCMGSFFVMGLYSLLRDVDIALANMFYQLIMPTLNIILYSAYIVATLCNLVKRN